MVSSSAMGFLIIPKITSPEMEFSIGFPKNVYPEISFYISGTDKDRGFQLKNMDGQGWSLFDRSSLEFIKGEAVSNAPVQLQIDKKQQGNFGALLSVATDDKALVTSMPPKDSIEKSSNDKVTSTPNSAISNAKTNSKEAALIKGGVKLPTITFSTQIDNEAIKQLVYIEKSPAGKADTILVQIEKVNGNSTSKITDIIPDTASALPRTENAASNAPNSPKVNPIVVCDRPFGDYKDIRSLQKKLLGMSGEDEQRAYTVKIFGQKCFNTKQALEIGWFFVDERSRLKLFTLLKPLISDPIFFRELESSFLKEENIVSFRELFFGGK